VAARIAGYPVTGPLAASGGGGGRGTGGGGQTRAGRDRSDPVDGRSVIWGMFAIAVTYLLLVIAESVVCVNRAWPQPMRVAPCGMAIASGFAPGFSAPPGSVL
jgi:hypothetical protein